jgi:uncharacterized protein (TIGR00255 family)
MLSMTGFGNGETVRDGRKLSVVVNTVNRKQLDVRLTLPRELAHKEADIRKRINTVLSRGAVTFCAEFDVDEQPSTVGINLPLAKDLWRQMNVLREELGVAEDLKMSDLFSVPEIFAIGGTDLSVEDMESMLEEAVTPALDALVESRKREGEALKVDVTQRRQILVDLFEKIKATVPQVPGLYRERLLARIKEFDAKLEIDEERLIKEVLIFADKSDVSEEMTRLESHLDQMDGMFQLDDSVGRKLDFLIQEMGREINTTGAKAAHKDVTKLVVDFKAELEKIREQIQNVE